MSSADQTAVSIPNEVIFKIIDPLIHDHLHFITAPCRSPGAPTRNSDRRHGLWKLLRLAQTSQLFKARVAELVKQKRAELIQTINELGSRFDLEHPIEDIKCSADDVERSRKRRSHVVNTRKKMTQYVEVLGRLRL